MGLKLIYLLTSIFYIYNTQKPMVTIDKNQGVKNNMCRISLPSQANSIKANLTLSP